MYNIKNDKNNKKGGVWGAGGGARLTQNHPIIGEKDTKEEETRFDVYETLCPQQMRVHKGGQIENWSGECRDIIPTKLQCQTIQRALQSPNLQREITRKKQLFFKFSPIDLLIILYQLTKFEAPSCYSF